MCPVKENVTRRSSNARFPVLTGETRTARCSTVKEKLENAFALNTFVRCAALMSPIRHGTPPPTQVVSKDYIPVERNFIRLMELNSALSRQHLYLVCMDDESLEFFAESMGIRCVPLSGFHLSSNRQLWVLRVRLLSCLVSRVVVRMDLGVDTSFWHVLCSLLGCKLSTTPLTLFLVLLFTYISYTTSTYRWNRDEMS